MADLTVGAETCLALGATETTSQTHPAWFVEQRLATAVTSRRGLRSSRMHAELALDRLECM